MAETEAPESIAITEKIVKLGEEIRDYKTSHPGLPKDDPELLKMVKSLGELKTEFKNVTGKDYGPPKVEKKKKEVVQPQVRNFFI